MDFGRTAEQEQLAAAETAWLTRHNPISRLRTCLDNAPVSIDADAVAHAAESGLLALLTPEMGGSHADLAVLTEAHAYAASSLPLADLALGVWLLSIAGLDEAAPAGEGNVLVGLVRAPLGSTASDGLTLRGHSGPISMAADMDRFVFISEAINGDYLQSLGAVQLEPMTTLDLTRTWGRLAFDESPAKPVRLPVGTVSYLRDALALHRAIDSVGAAARLLEMTVTYVRQREQFGVPIGSFQAVKHHCADMALWVEASRSICRTAALAMHGESTHRRHAVSAAAAYAKSAASRVASTALQVHGGIGFTWEHDLHLLLRRIKVNEAFDGSVAAHRAALVAV
jgi:alkylation response protein AidB-like acyl-CoA dehydrogenase